MSEKWTTDQIGDQSGRIALITGANSGLGLETAKALAAKNAKVVLAVRNLEKGGAAIDEIRRVAPDADLALQQLNLASLASITAAAKQINADYDHLDLLINNAGVMHTPRQQTEDGFELQFGTNHFGHYAFTGLVLPKLTAVEGSRIVSVASLGHRILSKINFEDLHAQKSYNRFSAYGRSKLANLLFTFELDRRLRAAGSQTAALAAHPGASATDLGRHLPGERLLHPVAKALIQNPDMGALPTLRAATDPAAVGGQYYGPRSPLETRGYPKVVGSNRASRNESLQAKLWAASEECTGITYPL